jgi:hypothetical protein
VAIDHSEWRGAEGRLKPRIITEFRPWEPLQTLPRMVARQATKIHCDHFDGGFRLSLRLGVKGRGHLQLDAHRLEQLTPKLTCEHQVSIGYDGAGNPVQPDYGVEEGPCYGGGRVRYPRGMKCPYLENLSTTVRITDLPLMRGSPSMKSMATYTHTVEGTSRS